VCRIANGLAGLEVKVGSGRRPGYSKPLSGPAGSKPSIPGILSSIILKLEDYFISKYVMCVVWLGVGNTLDFVSWNPPGNGNEGKDQYQEINSESEYIASVLKKNKAREGSRKKKYFEMVVKRVETPELVQFLAC